MRPLSSTLLLAAGAVGGLVFVAGFLVLGAFATGYAQLHEAISALEFTDLGKFGVRVKTTMGIKAVRQTFIHFADPNLHLPNRLTLHSPQDAGQKGMAMRRGRTR